MHLVWHYKSQYKVQQYRTAPAKKCEYHKNDPDNGRIPSEVFGYAAAYP